MYSIKPHSVVNKAGKNVPYDEYSKAPVLAYYFSRAWVPPAQKLTKELAELYKKWNATEKQIEIIYISSNDREDGFNEDYALMPWLTLPFQDDFAMLAIDRYGVDGIPCLLIVGQESQQDLGGDGVEDIKKKGEKAIDEWKKLYSQ